MSDVNAEIQHSLVLFVAQVAMLQQAINRDASREQVLARLGILEKDAQVLSEQLSRVDPALSEAIRRAWHEPARVIAAGTTK